MKARQIISLTALALSLLCLEDSEGASFTPLGLDTAYGVSDNGAFVAGTKRGTNFFEIAVRWSAANAVLELGLLSGASSSSVYAMSADGQVVVGESGGKAFRWAAQSGMVDLGTLPGKPYHVAWGVSGDGSVVVGSGDVGGDEEFVEPFRWTASEGIGGLGFLPGTSRGEALAISTDGEVIVGYSGDNEVQGFLRGPDRILRGLGFLPSYIESIARGVSAIGSVIVGECRDSSFPYHSQAFRWTELSGMTGLGMLAGFDQSDAQAVSADGLIIVGECNVSTNFSARRAFIWDSTHGMRELQAVLTNQFGLSLSGWSLKTADAISADGTTIVGSGTNPDGEDEAWMVKLTATQPILSIRRFSTSVLASWPMAFSNFVLQSRRSFAPTDVWSPVTNAPVLSNGEFVVTNSVVDGARFFQLRSQ